MPSKNGHVKYSLWISCEFFVTKSVKSNFDDIIDFIIIKKKWKDKKVFKMKNKWIDTFRKKSNYNK